MEGSRIERLDKLKQLLHRSHEHIEAVIDGAVAAGRGAHWGEIGAVIVDATTPYGELTADLFGDVEWTARGDVAVFATARGIVQEFVDEHIHDDVVCVEPATGGPYALLVVIYGVEDIVAFHLPKAHVAARLLYGLLEPRVDAYIEMAMRELGCAWKDVAILAVNRSGSVTCSPMLKKKFLAEMTGAPGITELPAVDADEALIMCGDGADTIIVRRAVPASSTEKGFTDDELDEVIGGIIAKGKVATWDDVGVWVVARNTTMAEDLLENVPPERLTDNHSPVVVPTTKAALTAVVIEQGLEVPARDGALVVFVTNVGMAISFHPKPRSTH